MKYKIFFGTLAILVTMTAPAVYAASDPGALSGSCYPAIDCDPGEDAYGAGAACRKTIDTVADCVAAGYPASSNSFSCSSGCYKASSGSGGPSCPTVTFTNVDDDDNPGTPAVSVVVPSLNLVDYNSMTQIFNCATKILKPYWTPGASSGTLYYNGNVGIGTSTPTSKLAVNGTIDLQGNIKNSASGSEPVTINDDDGFLISGPSLGDALEINRQGGIELLLTSSGTPPFGIIALGAPSGVTVRPSLFGAFNTAPYGSGNLSVIATSGGTTLDYGGNIFAKGGKLNGANLTLQRADTNSDGISDAPAGANLDLQGGISNSKPWSAAGTYTYGGDVYIDDALQVKNRVKANAGTSGVFLEASGAEAAWYNGTYYSWGYGGTYNVFADPVSVGTTANPSPYALRVNGDAVVSGKTDLNGNLYLNGNDIWGFSGSNMYAGGYINAGTYITANNIGDFEYGSSSFTLSPLARSTNCTFASSSMWGAYFTTISGGYRLTAGSPVKIEANYPADLYAEGKPTHWCVTAYNPSAFTSYTVDIYAFDWSSNLSPGSY